MSNKVSIVQCHEYKQESIDTTIRQAVEQIGGISSFVSSGQKVLIKPNILSASAPEKFITTHPAVVEAVVKIVQEAGGKVIIADSPGTTAPYTERGLRRVYEATGIEGVANRTGATLNLDTEVVELSHPYGVLTKRIELIKPVHEADVIINIPKLKTHTLTTFTGAIKNLFGLIPGHKKAAYHAKFQNAEVFSEMLLDVWSLVKPDLNIMDSIGGIEGEGPGSHGDPREIGVVIAGADSILVDAIACRIVGINYKSVPVLTSAIKRGWWDGDFGKIDLTGSSIDDVAISDFKKPSTVSVPIQNRFLGSIASFLLKAAFTPRPVPRREDCVACGACVRACPQDAISIVRKLAVVDDSRCIRCYCCHELCPESAIELKLSWLGWLIQKSGIAGQRT